MPDRESVITHLQIIHTWAEFAHERDLQFFTEKHLENIAEWTDDALGLLKEQEERINKMLHQPRSVICCYRCKWNSGTKDKPYCQKFSMARLPEWFCADEERR